MSTGTDLITYLIHSILRVIEIMYSTVLFYWGILPVTILNLALAVGVSNIILDFFINLFGGDSDVGGEIK